ncbi:S-layer homology domain-containing protein [Cytobacillus sp. IB215665]|uniref:S-layer homology domain-containing protein n=1 Tax=Cytobacillus sp. IB215665 TaxID=3097357 RepID=UPI002A10BF47|nr:S-layer homology domain-containing protein [Cytobacillus sp. IB215665]MDX8365750.1 S-layer homology domain-containing protein [Cytobacillus sp. IB215665]
MVQILRHEVETHGNNTTITVYVNEHRTEFATEFESKQNNDKNDLEESVQNYVKKRFPNLKKATVKVVVGSMLVTSFAVSPALGIIGGGNQAEAAEAEEETEEALESNFSDVSLENMDEETVSAINDLVDMGVITGYEDGTFQPWEDISRQHAAVMFVRMMELDTTDVEDPGFEDVDPDDLYYKEIAAAVEAGLFIKAENFNPTATFTRGQAATVLVRAFDLEGDKTTPFTDITDSGHDDMIGILFNNGITKGTTESTFSPHSEVKRSQFALFLFRTFQLDEVDDDTIGEANPDDEGNVDDEAGNPDDEAGNPDDEGNVPDDEAGNPDDEAGNPDDEGNVPDDEGNVPDDEGNVPDDEAGNPDDEGNVPDDEGNVPDDEGNVPDDEGNVPDDEGNVPDDEENV